MLSPDVADKLTDSTTAPTITASDIATQRTKSDDLLQYKSRKRHLPTSVSSDDSQAANDDDIVPILESIFCTVCKRVLDHDKFYPSCVRRKVHHCKECEQDKQAQRRRSHVGDATVQKNQKDDATLMLQRFRRRCAKERTSKIEDDCATQAAIENGYEPGALYEELDLISETSMTKLQVAFDVKTTRQLLKFWNHASALSKKAHSTIKNEVEDAEPSSVTAEPSLSEPSKRRRMTETATTQPSTVAATCTQLPESSQQDATSPQQRSSPSSPKFPVAKSSKAHLTLILWNKAKGTDSVQPWEVIPVTLAEAGDFRNTPSYIRPKLIAPQLAAALSVRLNQFRQQLKQSCSEQNNIHTN